MSLSEAFENRINRLFILLSIPLSLLIALILIKFDLIYALLGAVSLGLLVVTFTNTDFAIYILIFSMLLSPEIGSRTTSGEGMTIRIDDLILGIIILTWLAKTAINKELGLFRKTPLNKPIWIYTLVCILSTGIGMLAGRVNFLTGSLFVLKYTQYFMIYFMVMNQVRTKKQINNYLISLIITFIIVTIFALIQAPSGQRITAPFEGESGEPNTLGGYLVLLIAINLGLILNDDAITNRHLRRGLLLVTIISFYPLLMTYSRGSWLAAIAVIIAYIAVSKKRWIVFGIATLVFILAPYVFPQSVIDRVKYTFTEQQGYDATLQEHIGGITIDTSASERIRSWRSALKDVTKHPLLGFGVTGWRFLDAQYIRVLIETGIIGLVAFLYLQFSLLLNIRKVYSDAKTPLYRALAQGFFVGTIAMMAHSITANTFIIVRIIEPFWLACGLVMAVPEVEELETEKLPEIEKVPQQ
ncbi:MAG TPA: O-antigen ligase family protein [Candidatus Marinimicrobia bacterium]|nr:O-antigen ligase family protein [Candidatus Neomarinimicrobiota bacterium]HRU92744.1 O-antigen ligase family protein [Candidatus Neomarinimicrobiota bacterium]